MSEKITRVGLIAPGNLATKGGHTVKVYLEAEILSGFAKVSLYGYGSQTSEKYESHDLTKISPYSTSIRKSLRVFLGLCWTIIKSGFDYVLIPTVFNPLFPLLFIASRIAHSKIIYDFRDPIHGTMATMKAEVNSRTGSPILTWLMIRLSLLIESFLINRSDYIMTVSPLLVEYIKKFRKDSHERIFLYYNYVPSQIKRINDDTIPVVLKKAIRDKVVICYLGHIQVAIRGIEDIFKVLKDSANKDVFLVLLGEIDNKTHWESLIKEIGCENQVMILDPRPKPEALGYLSKCDYAILGPSPDNALPAKIFDALSVGIKFILPHNMTPARDVLGEYCIAYKDYSDLAALFNSLKKPKKDRDLSKVNDMLRRYSLDSRLAFIFSEILKDSDKNLLLHKTSSSVGSYSNAV